MMEQEQFLGGLAPDEKQIEAGGLNWNYLEWNPGGGRNIVLVHGITSDARAWWRVGPELAHAGARVVAVDMPGHGRTGESPTGTAWSTTAGQLAAFVAALGLDRAAYRLAGHSWGGVTSLHLAVEHPAGLERVALLDPALYLSPERSEEQSAVHAALVGQPRLSRQEYYQSSLATNPGWSEGDHYWKAAALAAYSPSTVRDFYRHNTDHNVVGWLGRVEVPLLLLISDENEGGVLSAALQAEAHAALKPGLGQAIYFPGVGHNLHRQDYEATMRALRPFLLGD